MLSHNLISKLSLVFFDLYIKHVIFYIKRIHATFKKKKIYDQDKLLFPIRSRVESP